MERRAARPSTSIAETGTGWEQQTVALGSGQLEGIIQRLDAGGGATAATFYVVDADGSTTYAAAPADDLLLFESASVTLTASATAADLNEIFSDTPVSYRTGLVLLINTTAGSGASTYEGCLLAVAD